jgi:CheY-like chemotaxis protein
MATQSRSGRPRTPPPQVLVIDDEKTIRATLSLCLEQIGCRVTSVSSPESALNALARAAYDLAFLDLRLGDSNGLDLIPKLLAENPNLMIRGDDRLRHHRQRRGSDQARRLAHCDLQQRLGSFVQNAKFKPAH